MALVPYRSNHDLIKLRRLLFHDNATNKRLGLEKVKMYLSRGKVPHAVNATASLVSLELMGNTESECLQQAYCSCLTRIVNGLLDPFQLASVALPLLKLAKEIGLPSSFVEIRHMATHEDLPSLDHLRLIAAEAKEWLSVNYWDHVVESAALVPERDRHQTFTSSNTTANLRVYKKLRKQALDMDAESKDEGHSRNLNAVIHKLKSDLQRSAQRQKLLRDLIFNGLIYTDKRNRDVLKRTKFKTLIKIYWPLLEELGREFQASLLFALIQHSSGRFSVALTTQEEEQAIPWVQHLIEQLVTGQFPISSRLHDVEALQDSIQTHMSLLKDNSVLFKAISSEATDEPPQKHTFRMPPSLDDLLGSPKRQKVSELPTPQPEALHTTQIETPESFFPSHPNWAPRPFGYRMN